MWGRALNRASNSSAEIVMPASRKIPIKSCNLPSIADRVSVLSLPLMFENVLGFLYGLLYVFFVFEDQIQGFHRRLAGELLYPEDDQGPGPIEGFADAGLFFKLELPDLMHRGHNVSPKLAAAFGNFEGDYAFFQLAVRIIDVQVKAAPLQRIRHLPRIVG